VIRGSQRSFKELIDSFDDVAFAMSLEGILRTVNRRMAEALGLTYGEIVGHRLDEFIEEPQRSMVEAGLGRFVEKRRWAGFTKVTGKKTGRVAYFDCVRNPIWKHDEGVRGSARAR